MAAVPSAPPRPTAEAFVIPDRAEFLRSLDLSRPELRPVREALDRGDVDAAGRAYIAHFRTRDMKSPLLTDWPATPRKADFHNAIADDCLRGRIADGYNVYDAPAGGIDWYDCPLFCLPRFPIFPHLLEAFHHAQDGRYLRFIVDHSLEYIRAYPIEGFAGKHSFEGQRGHYLVGPPTWWCLLPNRQDEWTSALAAIRSSPLVSDEELLTILHRMLQEIRYLMTQVPFWVEEAGNVVGFTVRVMGKITCVMGDFAEAAGWRDLNAQWLVRYLKDAFYPDGLFKELTMAYGSSCAEQTSQIAYVLRELPQVQAQRGHLREMLTSLVALATPTGRIPAYGDLYPMPLSEALYGPLVEWLDEPWMAASLARAKRVDAGGAASRDPAALAARSSHEPAPTPAPPFLAWPRRGQEAWGGYYAMRSDWSPAARYMVIDGGPWGLAHQHMDKLSFDLTAFGADFIVDPCCTTYANNEPGARLSTLHAGFMHNTITVDGVDEFVTDEESLATSRPLDSVWIEAADHTLFAGSFDFAPLKRVRWQRRIVFVDGAYWLLQDVLTGEEPAANIEQNFQFDQGISVELSDAGAAATAGNGARLLIAPLDGGLTPEVHVAEEGRHATYSTQYAVYSKPGHLDHGRGWVARTTKSIIPAPAVTYSGRCNLPHIITMAIVPFAPGADIAEPPKIAKAAGPDGSTIWTLPTRRGAVRLFSSPADFRVV